LPDDSRVLNIGASQPEANQLLIVTSDNRVILTDRSRSPLGSITSTRFELDRNNNFSRTEILTNYPENRFDLPPLPAQQIPSEATNIPGAPIPEEIYNRFRFNIEHVSDESLVNIFDIFTRLGEYISLFINKTKKKKKNKNKIKRKLIKR